MKHQPTSLRSRDRAIYEERIRPWLPPTMIDCHVHAGLAEHWGPVSAERRKEIWAIEVAGAYAWPELRADLATLFPAQRVMALVFGYVFREIDIERSNQYVLGGVKGPSNLSQALFVTRPEWPASAIEDALGQGFLGIKPYPDLSPKGMNESSIYDFVPHEHLEVLNQRKALMMLHLPRPGRIGDEDNIRELIEISRRYPDARIIVAHIGRAYGLPNAVRGLPRLTSCGNLYFDTAANLNTEVFEFALKTLGPERILYGSDLPITLMRGVREHVGDAYFNYTDADYSWNSKRKSPEEEAEYTFFLYEELLALIGAVERLGMGAEEMHKIMFGNASALTGMA
jgi:uncharacterized protein